MGSSSRRAWPASPPAYIGPPICLSSPAKKMRCVRRVAWRGWGSALHQAMHRAMYHVGRHELRQDRAQQPRHVLRQAAGTMEQTSYRAASERRPGPSTDQTVSGVLLKVLTGNVPPDTLAVQPSRAQDDTTRLSKHLLKWCARSSDISLN